MAISSDLPGSSEGLRSLSSTAAEDLIGGLCKVELWGRIGWLDVKRRYRRTMIGPFWSTITLAVYVIAVGLVGAGLWNQQIRSYLPYLSSGMIVWTLISTIIIEACTLLVVGHALFRNVRFEYSILAYALVWRNFVVFAHNFVVYFVLTLILQPSLLGPVGLLAIPGIALVLVNGVWIGLLVSMFCLRYRDVQQIIQTLIQIMMLVTPIFWSAENLNGTNRIVFVQLNPIYRLIDVVRAPLLGKIPAMSSYLAVAAITIVGWTVTVLIFQRFRRRISYWS
jgi:ABC-type polysaccharide/polyol phosphate export permease